MEKRRLLFVTHRNENMTEGVSYAMELAKAMNEDIMILLVQKRTDLNSKFENLMAAVTFAEAGEHEAARQMVPESRRYPDDATNQDFVGVVEKCLREGVRVTVHTSPRDAISGVRTFLKEQGGIDRVVLSPAITTAGNISSRDIKRLVQGISRPVVTMARQPLAVN